MKKKSVKKFLNIPIIVPPPLAIGQSRPPVPFWDSMKKYAAAQAMEQQKLGNSKPSLWSRIFYPSRLLNGRTSSEEKPQSIISSSSSVLSHRIKNLEKQAKGRKKNKRRPVWKATLKFMHLDLLIMMSIYQIMSYRIKEITYLSYSFLL